MKKGMFSHFVLTVLLICVVTIVQLSMNIFVQARAFNQHNQTTNLDFLNNFTDVSNGLYHSCGLTTTGDVYCWGLNTSGQLGNGTLIDSTVPVAVTMPAGVTFSTIDVGDSHSCALSSQGNAYCWGDNQTVQIGDGTQTNRTIPTAVSMPTDVTFVTISAGGYQTCALSSINTAYCWGVYRWRTSNNDWIYSATPRLTNVPSGSTSVTSIDVGFMHICIITNIGKAYCGGQNLNRSLGTGSSAEWSDMSAVLLPSDVTVSHISAGRYHTCAVTTNGVLYCWGKNENGRLGTGTSNGVDSSNPKSVIHESGIAFTSVIAGLDNTCATDTMNTIYCWGYNEFGQLGTYDTLSYTSPSPISILNDQTITHISLGAFHTCASTASGRVFCWGANEKGQLGDGTKHLRCASRCFFNTYKCRHTHTDIHTNPAAVY
jgi:alpha-tubulin suppressor-like RCC1 family protein